VILRGFYFNVTKLFEDEGEGKGVRFAAAMTDEFDNAEEVFGDTAEEAITVLAADVD
jgi:hypothetical protein